MNFVIIVNTQYDITAGSSLPQQSTEMMMIKRTDNDPNTIMSFLYMTTASAPIQNTEDKAK